MNSSSSMYYEALENLFQKFIQPVSFCSTIKWELKCLPHRILSRINRDDINKGLQSEANILCTGFLKNFLFNSDSLQIKLWDKFGVMQADKNCDKLQRFLNGFLKGMATIPLQPSTAKQEHRSCNVFEFKTSQKVHFLTCELSSFLKHWNVI